MQLSRFGVLAAFASLAVAQSSATKTTYGLGCNDSAATFHETFTSGTFDLGGTSIQLLPTGTGYIVLPGSGATWFTPVSPNLGLFDDQVSPAQTLPLPWPTPAGTTNQVWISSNGFVWTRASTDSGCCNGDPQLLVQGAERFAPLWMDLNPGSGGSVHFDVDTATATAYVTWLNVPEYPSSGANSAQLAIQPGGILEFRWQTGTANVAHTALVGYSPGGNARSVPSTDLSVALPVITAPDRYPLALDTPSRPILGTTFSMVTTRIPTGTTLGALVMGLTPIVPAASLAGIGMGECWQHTSPDATRIFLVAGASASTPVTLPANPIFNGVHLYVQAATFSAGANALGVLASNAVDLGLGTF